MKFLDLNGLKHLLKFMDRTVSVVSSNFQTNSHGRRDIPFITNHQIIDANSSAYGVNVYDWFQKASKGGILEIVFAGAELGNIYCRRYDGINYMYKTILSSSVPTLQSINFLPTAYNTYTRLIKTDDNKLIIAMFYQSK